MSGNRDLRNALDAATRIVVVPEYKAELERLRKLHGHAITVLAEAKDRMDRFNCYAYALGVWDRDSFIRAVEGTGASALIDSPIMQQLLDSAFLIERPAEAVQPGDIAIYSHKDKPTHGAVIVRTADPAAMHSKWGLAELHEHGTWELPAEYGDRLRYYAKPDPDAAWTCVNALLDDADA